MCSTCGLGSIIERVAIDGSLLIDVIFFEGHRTEAIAAKVRAKYGQEGFPFLRLPFGFVDD